MKHNGAKHVHEDTHVQSELHSTVATAYPAQPAFSSSSPSFLLLPARDTYSMRAIQTYRACVQSSLHCCQHARDACSPDQGNLACLSYFATEEPLMRKWRVEANRRRWVAISGPEQKRVLDPLMKTRRWGARETENGEAKRERKSTERNYLLFVKSNNARTCQCAEFPLPEHLTRNSAQLVPFWDASIAPKLLLIKFDGALINEVVTRCKSFVTPCYIYERLASVCRTKNEGCLTPPRWQLVRADHNE